jgi:hypothetical protein
MQTSRPSILLCEEDMNCGFDFRCCCRLVKIVPTLGQLKSENSRTVESRGRGLTRDFAGSQSSTSFPIILHHPDSVYNLLLLSGELRDIKVYILQLFLHYLKSQPRESGSYTPPHQNPIDKMDTACCTCAQLLAHVSPIYDGKTEKPKELDRTLDCCGRLVCRNCIHVRSCPSFCASC